MTGNTATAKQISYINSLKSQRDVSVGTDAAEALELGRQLWHFGKFSSKAASAVIDALKAAGPKPADHGTEVVEISTGRAKSSTPEGMHKFGGVIFKVQKAIHGSGRLYAKALVEDGDGGWRFEYAQGAVHNLSESTRLTIEEAKEFGALYGTCCVCGRTLTNEESIEAGIGPICAGKF